MPYCSYDDIELRLGAEDLAALADHDGDGSADAQVVAAAIEDAQALIDSHLCVRFSVPVEPVPEALRARAVNLAVYFLCLRRDSATEDARRQYREDLAWLRGVVRGRVSLGVEPSPAESSGAPGVEYEGRSRLFGRDQPL